ncbi:MAG: hypothetical protein JSW52_04130 [Candidatus Coatesbacteria bacterium]|nr:MAG: hypothetical protein JSW52_04130 [Candidatus Coatesbacteria bacterium]
MKTPVWRKYFVGGLFALAAVIGIIGAFFSPAAGASALAGAAVVAFNFWALIALGIYFFAANGRKKIVVGLLFLLHLLIVPAALVAIFVFLPGFAVAAALGALGEATAGPLLMGSISLAYR